jgi:hypothetical protein
MGRKIGYLALALLITATLFVIPAYAQDAGGTTQVTAAPVKEDVDAAMKSEELSIYGEVQSSDATAPGSLTVQYYDYDTDEEKTIAIALDANTKIENAGSVADIKKGDWADISYVVSDGKSVAKSIIVEKEEIEPIAASGAGDAQPQAGIPDDE